MNKYLWVGSLMIAAVGLDLGTKTLAENRLASRTQDYQHYLHVDVPESAAGQTIAEVLATELAWNSDDEVAEIANGASFLVDESGDIIARASADRELIGGERIEIQYRTVTLIEGFLSFRYVENRGAAWGLLQNFDHSMRQPFFIAVGLIAIVVIFLLVRSASPDRKLLLTALALIVGGAVGNIVDRIRYGYVVDFILWYPGFEWPTFNVADAFIVVGVALMFIEVIRDGVRERRARASAS